MKKIIPLMLLTYIVGSASAQISLSSGQVGYWPLNASADESIYGNVQASVEGCLPSSDRFGRDAKAYSFNGISSTITFDKPLLPTDGSDFTLNMWFNNTNPTTSVHDIIFSQYIYNHSDFNDRFEIFVLDGKLQVFYGGYNIPCVGEAVVANEWTNVQVTAQSGLLSFYQNGTLIADTIKVSEIQNVKSVLGTDNTIHNRMFAGSIDDMRIFNRALSPLELKYLQYENETLFSVQPMRTDTLVTIIPVIDTVYATVFDTITVTVTDTVFVTLIDTLHSSVTVVDTTVQSDMFGYWPFNGNADEVLYGVENGVVAGCETVAGRFGINSSALSFDGQSDVVKFDRPLLPTDGSDWSLSMWFAPNDVKTAGHDVIFSQYLYNNSDFGDRFHVFVMDGYLKFFYGAYQDPFIAGRVENGVWYNFQVVVKDSFLTFYQDGVVIAENIKVDEFQNTNTVLGFDNTVYDRFFSGSVDDMRLFNRALTPAEMKNIIFESLSSCNTSYPIKDSLSNNNTKNIIHKIEVPVNNNKETHVIFDKLNFQSEITRNTVPLKNVEPDVNIFTFSPNPTSAAVSFRFSKNVILNGNLLIIRDINGMIVFETGIDRETIAVDTKSYFHSGVYSVAVTDASGNVIGQDKMIVE